MSDKPQHGKSSKRHVQSKKSKAKQRAASLPRQEAGYIEEPVTPAEAAPVKKAPAARAAHRYPYVTAELRWIGILAVVIVFILVMLALFLP